MASCLQSKIAQNIIILISVCVIMIMITIAFIDLVVEDEKLDININREVFINVDPMLDQNVTAEPNHDINKRSINNNKKKKINQRLYSLPKNTQILTEDLYFLGYKNHQKKGMSQGFISVRYGNKKEKRFEDENESTNINSINLHRSKLNERLINLRKGTKTEINKKSEFFKDYVTISNNICSNFYDINAYWKRSAHWVLDSSNNQLLSDNYIYSVLNTSMYQYNSLLSNFNVFGVRDTTKTVDRSASSAPNGANEIYFAAIDDMNVIAYTIIWGVFEGQLSHREIFESDIIFNDNYAWGDATLKGSAVMDTKNEATHELGHFVGMMHSSVRSECIDTTMWPFSNLGETKKSTLSDYDKVGYCTLYNIFTCTYEFNSSYPGIYESSSSNAIKKYYKFNNLLLIITIIICIVNSI